MVEYSDQCEFTKSIRTALENVLRSIDSCTIALSGGLDSSIIAHLRANDAHTRCISIVSSDFTSPDMAYSQTIARKTGLHLDIINTSIVEILDAIDSTITILGNYNTMEVRNSAVLYLALYNVNERNTDLVLTGDGADELFAGYSFLVNSPAGHLRSKLERLQRIMHFPSIDIAKSLELDISLPYLGKSVIDISRNIPDDLLVRKGDYGKIGKWILRKAFENDLPSKIAWRQKTPMSKGAGFDGLTGFLDRTIPDAVFEKRCANILEKDGVKIRDKESLHYYTIYRKHYDVPTCASEGKPACPDCHSDTSANDGAFCRMCGKFPI